MHAVVAVPPDYGQTRDRYPVVYVLHAFGKTGASAAFDNSPFDARRVVDAMRSSALPKMIFVYPDASSSLGDTEFADSANNGPWASAFVHDLVPYVQRTFRTQPHAQFLTGHSSGAWSALWLQTQYPALFAGAWAVSPDPVDFRSFLGTDIYAPGANFYARGGRQTAYQVDGARTVLTNRQAVKLESVEGPWGGQLASFDAVFSPRGADGTPRNLFDPRTGAIDPSVAKAWRAYDLSRILSANWTRLAPALRGKLHIIVGDRDNFSLNKAVSLLGERLPPGAESIRVLPGRDHFDVYSGGLAPHIIDEMRRTAAQRNTARAVARN